MPLLIPETALASVIQLITVIIIPQIKIFESIPKILLIPPLILKTAAYRDAAKPDTKENTQIKSMIFPADF